MSRYQVYELRSLPLAIGDLVRLQEKVVLESAKGKYQKKKVFERGSIQKLVEHLPDGTLIFESGLKLSEKRMAVSLKDMFPPQFPPRA